MRKDKLYCVFLMVALAVSPFAGGATVSAAVSSRYDICDATADYFLGIEDYPEAAKLHRILVAAHPDEALAHYHLGFAYGMLGRHTEELAEYRRAASLGLKQWDLFLNLGLAYLEDGNNDAATDTLTTAVALGPGHPEAHFNLGLVYERRGMLAEAKREMLTSLRLDPNQPEARNMLGVIYAEDGDYATAHEVWSELARTGFEPARSNLAILDRASVASNIGLPRHASLVRSTMSAKQP
ncbi:MAG TPA: tetratricopeptide repeat protein [Nitrospira sp.]|nr:tetratricopeptide repeat protein [Nitrospira sp.]